MKAIKNKSFFKSNLLYKIKVILNQKVDKSKLYKISRLWNHKALRISSFTAMNQANENQTVFIV